MRKKTPQAIWFHRKGPSSLGTGEATKADEFSEFELPSFSENCIAIFSRKKPCLKPCLKVQNLQYKFPDWKWAPLPLWNVSKKNHPFWYPDPSLTLPPSKKAERMVWIALPHPTWITRGSEGIFLKEGTWNQNAGVYKTKTTCFVCLEDSSHSLLWTTYRSEKHKYDHPHHDIEGRFVKLWSEPPACQPEGQHEWPFSASLLCKHQI